MSPERLSILYVSHMPASPPRFGAQARVHGLMTQLARRHELTAVMLVDDEFDAEECRRAMQAYCREVVLVPNPNGRDGLSKRLLQLRSLASTRSFERLRVTVPALQRALDQVLRAKRFDLVNLEFSFLGHCDLRQAPPGEKLPALVVDSHNIDYELARQYARAGGSLVRRLYAAANWRKLRREELATYRDADGVYLCSAADERRLLDAGPRGPHGRHSQRSGRRILPAAPHGPAAGRPHRGFLRAPLLRPQYRRGDPLRPGHLAAHRGGAPRGALQDHRRPTAAVAPCPGRAPGRADRLCVGPAATPCGSRGCGGAAAAGRRHPPQDRRGDGHGKGHRLDHAGRRRDRGCPRARPPHRG